MTTITRQTGRGGPKHDPYSFTELTVTRTSPHFTGSVTIHEGLGTWCEWQSCGSSDGGKAYGETLARGLFETFAGVSPNGAERAYDEFRERKIRYHTCGRRHLQWVDGYPGESLLHCSKCGAVLDGTFDKSAVE